MAREQEEHRQKWISAVGERREGKGSREYLEL